MNLLHSAPKRLSIPTSFCLSASLALAGMAFLPSAAVAWQQSGQSAPGFSGPQQAPIESYMASPLDGVWTTQTPQGLRVFRISGNRYVQTVGGQLLDEGIFQILPDGRFQYQVTGGPYAGQRGENRLSCDGRTLVMAWPDGTSATFVREGQGGSMPGQQWGSPAPSPAPAPEGGWGQQPAPAPGNSWGQPMAPATPLEGRWIWAKQGQASFGFIFNGNRFTSFWNGQTTATGTFELRGPLLVLRHETGNDAGRVDNLGCQLSGNRMVLHVGQNPDDNPIPFVRQ